MTKVCRSNVAEHHPPTATLADSLSRTQYYAQVLFDAQELQVLALETHCLPLATLIKVDQGLIDAEDEHLALIESVRISFWKTMNVNYALNAILGVYPWVRHDRDGFKFPHTVVRRNVEKPDSLTRLFADLWKVVFDRVMDHPDFDLHNPVVNALLGRLVENIWEADPIPTPDGNMEKWDEDYDWCKDIVRELWASVIHSSYFCLKLKNLTRTREVMVRVKRHDLPNFPDGPFPSWYHLVAESLGYTYAKPKGDLFLCNSKAFAGMAEIEESKENAVIWRLETAEA